MKPKKDEVKITVDAPMFNESSKYGIDQGEVIQGRAELFHGDVNPKYTETIAVKKALSWVKGGAWGKVEIETDCMAVVKAVRIKSIMALPLVRL